MFNLFKKHPDATQQRNAILIAINKALASGQCVILGEMPDGTRAIILGKPLYQRQAEEILKDKGW